MRLRGPRRPHRAGSWRRHRRAGSADAELPALAGARCTEPGAPHRRRHDSGAGRGQQQQPAGEHQSRHRWNLDPHHPGSGTARRAGSSWHAGSEPNSPSVGIRRPAPASRLSRSAVRRSAGPTVLKSWPARDATGSLPRSVRARTWFGLLPGTTWGWARPRTKSGSASASPPRRIRRLDWPLRSLTIR